MVMLGGSPTAVSWSWLGCQRKSKAVKGKVCTKSAATIEQHVDGQTNGLKFFLFDCPSHVHASPPTPPASATIEQHVDGHTNSIKIIPFVCLSQACVTLRRPHPRHPLPSSNHGDGQTNWKNFIPFVCPSQVNASPLLHCRHRRHPLPSSNYGDGRTNGKKIIPFVCLSQVHASPLAPPASATTKYDRACNQ